MGWITLGDTASRLNPRAAKASADEESDDGDERVVVDPTTGIIRMAPAAKSNGAAARA
jgi:hypothetical protein